MSKPEVVATARTIRNEGPNVLFAEFGVFDTAGPIADGTKLIRLTDHEAAMAELEAENRHLLSAGQALEADYSSWRREVDHKSDFHEAERNELLGLLREAREIIEVISPYDSEATRRIDATLAKCGETK